MVALSMGMTVGEVQALLKDADEKELAALERALAADSRKGVRSALAAARKRLDARRAEEERVRRLYEFERGFLSEGQGVIVGLDEVGRGAVAGPLAVGAVALPPESVVLGLDDSKKLSPEQRESAAERVKAAALGWAVFYVQPHDIDRDGMTASLRRAFRGALAQLESGGTVADVVLIDGNPLHMDEREANVVKGDAKCASIAAASIVAKVERDALMCRLAGEYPEYGFGENKGYGSARHIDAIRAFGLSDVHRASFCRSFMQESLF